MTTQEALQKIMDVIQHIGIDEETLEPELAYILDDLYQEGSDDGYNCACQDFKNTLDKAKEFIYNDMRL